MDEGDVDDGDQSTGSAAVGADGSFRQPAAHVRRASKRSRKESRKESLKEVHAKERPAVLQEQLDPTAGRRNSRTRVYSGRQKTSE